MQPFFPKSTLDSTRVIVLYGEPAGNRAFYGQLVKMGFEPATLPNFSLMTEITFVDAVVSHEQFTGRLLFHELVHVFQYEKRGVAEFAAKYARGFLSGGSLERNAYELDEWFAAAPATDCSVSDEVQRWIRLDRF